MKNKLALGPTVLDNDTLVPCRKITYEGWYSLEAIQDVRIANLKDLDKLAIENIVEEFRTMLLEKVQDGR